MRVLIIDDHALFRVGLKGLLEQRSIEVVGVAADGTEGIDLAGKLNPDIILLDLRMPGMGGLEVLSVLREKNQSTPVVMLTTSNEETDLIKSLRSGAQGYLLKDMHPDKIIESIEEVLSGGAPMNSNIAKVLKERLL